MAKKKSRSGTAKSPSAAKVTSFAGVVRGASRSVQAVGKALRSLVLEELPGAEERFFSARRPMAMFRTTGDVCWIQPQNAYCNLYFARGTELTDPDSILMGSSDRFRFARIHSLEDVEQLPLREWLQESVRLNEQAIGNGLSYAQVMKRLRKICLGLPNTKETLTWGIPHFRVGEKIFCGCAEDHGRPRVGMKMEPRHSEVMMKLPGIIKSPYSRKGDGWVTIDPNVFDDWSEIETLLVGSYRLIAPKRTLALLDAKQNKPLNQSAELNAS